MPHEEFQLGPLRTPMVIVEGDGEHVINEQSVRVVVDPVEVELPDDDDHRENWSSVAPSLFCLVLIRRFGRARVERETARTLRGLGQVSG